MKSFPQPPNRTNLTATYGPISDLLLAAKNQKILVEVESSNGQERDGQNSVGENTSPSKFKFVDGSEIQKEERPKSAMAAAIVRKLRWSTLGLQFDWSKVSMDPFLLGQFFFEESFMAVLTITDVYYLVFLEFDYFSLC